MATHAPKGQVCNCRLRGWMPGVEHIPIRWPRPAHIMREEGLMEPWVVVDHIAQGWIRTIDGWAGNGARKIITHFGIERGGRIVQYQDIHTEGIHVSQVYNPSAARVQQFGAVAGRGANAYSIGIEHEGFSVNPGYGYDYLYSAGRPWPEAMVDASIKVKRWIFAQEDTHLGEPSRDSIIGHYEIDAKDRPHDPAPAHARAVWPVARMIRELAPPVLPDTYTVKSGDTLGAIALRFGVALEDLQRWNAITNADHLVIGQVLRFAAPKPNDEGQPPGASQQRALLEIQRFELALSDAQEHLRRAKQALA